MSYRARTMAGLRSLADGIPRAVEALIGLCVVASTWSGAATAAERFADLHYGPDPQQVLDLALPPNRGRPTPVVVYFHGGAFVGGDKHPCAPNIVEALAEQGIAFACANYRLAPRVTYPAPMLDGARAVQWLRAHAAEYNLDPAHVAVMGLSAGGGIALWVAFHGDLADPGAADPVLRQSTRVSAVVTSNAQATYDPATIESDLHTRNFPKFLTDLFGAGSIEDLSAERFQRAARDASPITHMHAGEPPLLAYYTSDAGAELPPDSDPQAYIHSPAQGEILKKVGEANGASVTVHSGHFYPDGWRGFIGAAVRFLSASFQN